MRELKDLAVVYGILVQNGQLLAGQPTARLEVTTVKPDHDSFNEYLASLNPLKGEETGAKRGADEGETGADEGPSEGTEPAGQGASGRTGAGLGPTAGAGRVIEIPGSDSGSEGQQHKP